MVVAAQLQVELECQVAKVLILTLRLGNFRADAADGMNPVLDIAQTLNTLIERNWSRRQDYKEQL